MTMIVGKATITVSRFERNGVRVDTYRDLEHMLTELLTNSGDEIPYIVRDRILPEAIRVWDAAKYKDEHPSCNRHTDCKAADAKWLESHPGEKFVPLNMHCRDDECEDCFGS